MKYKVLRSVLSKDVLEYACSYFAMKEKATRYLFNNKLISPYCKMFGTYKDSFKELENTYNLYGDPLGDTILTKLKGLVEKEYKKALIETYSYMRIYKNGDILPRHKDRKSCEISGTLNICGDSWPIYLDTTGAKGRPGDRVDLGPGDMLLYRGCDFEHWRDAFKGKNCTQLFLHYNPKYGKNSIKYDGRPMLGLPDYN